MFERRERRGDSPRRLTETVIRGAGYAAIGYGLTQFLTFVSYLVLAHVVTPSEFGVFAAGSIFVGLTGLFVGSGMIAALIQRRDRLEEATNTALISTVSAGIALSVLALVVAPIVGHLFRSDQVGAVAAVLSGVLLLDATTIVPEALMQRRFSFLRRMVVQPLGVSVFGVTAVAAAANGAGVWGLVVGTYASKVVQAIASWALVRWRPQPRLASFAMWRELAGYGRHVVTGELLRRVEAQIPTVLLGRFVSTASLGEFQYALRVAAMPFGALVDIVAYVLLPAFARISHDQARLRGAFLRALRWVCVIAFPMSFILVPLGEPLVVLLFGEPWRQAGVAVMAMFALSAGHAFDSLASEVWKASGRPHMLPRLHLVSALLSATFMVLLIPFELVGVAIAVSISSIGVATYAILSVRKTLDLALARMLAEIWPPAIASGLMVAVVYPLEQMAASSERGTAAGLGLLVGEAAVGAAVYLAVLCVVARDRARDLHAVVRVVARRLHPPGSQPHSEAGPRR
jgi:O-antigen/teichoic acid export membrane protein